MYKISIILEILVLILGYFYIDLQKQYSVSISNNKALIYQNDSILSNNRMFKLTIDELKYYKDSIDTKLLETAEELNIKEKKIKQLQYIKSTANKVDTVIVKDTIFKQDVKVDTTLSQEWYTLNLKLNYPNTVIVNPRFRSEKYVVVNSKRETILPPKKFFLCRWFQKKHTVLEIHVVEKNPYIQVEDYKFIEILDK